MNIKHLLLLTSIASSLVATTAWSQTSMQFNNNKNSYSTQRQVQSSTISISAATLSQPHILIVSVSRGNIDGLIKLNGRVLQNIKDRNTRIDLSSYLSRGTNTIEILGKYNIKNASVKVELVAPQTQVSQQTSNNGSLNQTIILQVR